MALVEPVGFLADSRMLVSLYEADYDELTARLDDLERNRMASASVR
ncbi:MAG: hypothetical protein JWN99_3409 [Ilumatobacteraceae bacterium]|nr:hypothetical protein [Ilumatobacteraceae bacterium]